jgi:hypothetical protein
MWYVARLRDARQWNSLVNTKEKQLCNSGGPEIGYNRHNYVVFFDTGNKA